MMIISVAIVQYVRINCNMLHSFVILIQELSHAESSFDSHIDRNAFAFHQFIELFTGEAEDELVVFAVCHMNDNRREEPFLFVVDIANICILHFDVEVFGGDCQIVCPVGDGLVIRNDLPAGEEGVVAEVYVKGLFLHDIILRSRQRPHVLQFTTTRGSENRVK